MDSISSSCSGLSGSPSVSSFSSGECGNALYYGIVMVSIGSYSTRSPSVSTFSSGECGNAILQYCYGFNRLQLWLLAQGLLQSVLSLQVSVAMPYYSIVWFQKASALALSTGSPSVSSFSSGECDNTILQYCYGFNSLQLWLLAQGLLQSVLSLQVSVAIPYNSIVMVSIGYAKISNVKIPVFQKC